jgi:adenine-specific DNA-methyltransferase
MHAKSGEVTQFLERDLLPQVKKAFERYQPADKVTLERELAKAIEQAQALGLEQPAPREEPKY